MVDQRDSPFKLDAAAYQRAASLMYRPTSNADSVSQSPGKIDPNNYVNSVGSGYQPSTLNAGAKTAVESPSSVTPRRRAQRQPTADLSAILEAAEEEESSPSGKVVAIRTPRRPSAELESPWERVASLLERPWQAIKESSSEAFDNLVQHASHEDAEDRRFLHLVCSPSKAGGGRDDGKDSSSEVLEGHPIAELLVPPSPILPSVSPAPRAGAYHAAEIAEMRAALGVMQNGQEALLAEVMALREMRQRVEHLEGRHEALQRSYHTLASNHADLHTAHTALQLSHEALQKMQRQLVAQQPPSTDAHAGALHERRQLMTLNADHALPPAPRLPPPAPELRRSAADGECSSGSADAGFRPSRRTDGGVVLQPAATKSNGRFIATTTNIDKPAVVPPIVVDLPDLPLLNGKVKPLRKVNPGLASRLAMFSPRRTPKSAGEAGTAQQYV